ncbi:MAG: WD40 repeat domain-containing protein [Nitrospira sp.]
MATTGELTNLSNDVYNPSGAPTGWTRINEFPGNGGFYGAVYQNADGELFAAMRGMEKSLLDVGVIAQVKLGLKPRVSACERIIIHKKVRATMQIIARNTLITTTAAVLAIGCGEFPIPFIPSFSAKDLAMATERPSEETKPPMWTIKHRLHHDSGVTTVAMSPNGREVSAGGILSPTISVWNVETGARIRVLKGLKGSTQALAYSADGRFFAAGRGMITSADTCVFVFQAGTDRILQRLQPPPIVTRDAPKGVGMVESLQYSPDSQFLAVGFQGGAIGIYEAATGHLRQSVTLNSSLQGPIAYSPNGQLLALGQWNKNESNLFHPHVIHLLRPSTGDIMKSLAGHSDLVLALSFSPDGRYLASGSNTGAMRIGLDKKTNQGVERRNEDPIRIWDVETGEIVKEFVGHRGAVRSVTFADRGQTLVSGSYDRTVRIWDFERTDNIVTLTAHHDLINSIAVTQDGTSLVSGGDSGDISIWKQKP